MEQLEEQLDALWDESRTKRRAKVDELNAALVQRVRDGVDATLQKVQSALAGEQAEMEREIDRLLRMIDELAAGVEMWKQKALSSMDFIDKEQKALGSMVQQLSIRTAARKEEMMKRQRQRLEELRSACMERFKEVELRF
ncbi:hypothetical protein, conserved [Trypanosoma cruzi]|uniref:Uncharacterized protein n=1 Tax=Trypanosoma cruzi (strain CL Brener) TaxID=353153 RepID=Q4E4K6_TRYCC|nr:hypothetical protein, conserved [Trypanosoma cruzi]EAN99739.1 hypothetical protein, conserved [Trypanosoma cruzi]|eukprot:XP_821590.1 hypothetical protein [Trypanosoma cruzi strain CL Brener]